MNAALLAFTAAERRPAALSRHLLHAANPQLQQQRGARQTGGTDGREQ